MGERGLDPAADSNWLTPFEDLIQPGQLPEFGITMLISTDMATGQRSLAWSYDSAGGVAGVDAMLVVGALAMMQRQVQVQVTA